MSQTIETQGRTYSFRRTSSRRNGTSKITFTRDDGAKAEYDGNNAWRYEHFVALIPTLSFQLPSEVSRKPRAECQVCTHTQALRKSGTLGNHGYRRPGWGMIVGNCPGVHHKPFPETDALEAWLPRVIAHAEHCERQSKEAVTVEFDTGKREAPRSWGERPRAIVVKVSSKAEWDAEVAKMDESTRLRYGYHDASYGKCYGKAVDALRASFRGEAARARREAEWVETRIAKGKELRGVTE